MNWNRARDYLVSQLMQASTWRGLILIVTAAGAKLAPTHIEAIVTGGLFLAGLVAAALPDELPRREPPAPDDQAGV